MHAYSRTWSVQNKTLDITWDNFINKNNRTRITAVTPNSEMDVTERKPSTG